MPSFILRCSQPTGKVADKVSHNAADASHIRCDCVKVSMPKYCAVKTMYETGNGILLSIAARLGFDFCSASIFICMASNDAGESRLFGC